MEDRYSSAFDEIRASDDFKARMVDRMRQLNEIEEPVARRAPVSVPRRVRKRTLTILVAAAILLMAGTALAIGINAMIGARNRAQTAIASYQAVLEGRGTPEGSAELPENSVPQPSPYITYAQFQADEDGKWVPNTIPDIDVTAPVGSLTVRLTELISRTEFDQLACYLLVEGEKPVPYSLSEIRMSINGGEALKTKSEMDWEQNHAIGQALSVKGEATFTAVQRLQAELADVKFRAAALEEESFRRTAAEYEGRGDVLLIVPPLQGDGVRRLCDAVSQTCGGRCIVFSGEGTGYKYAVIHPGQDIRQMVKEMNTALNGRGGGRDGFAQGSVQATDAQIRAYFEN